MAEEAEGGGQAYPDFEFYRPHPFLDYFPGASEEDIEMLRFDIAKHGVEQDIVIWRDSKTKAWLIDGRTRQEAASREYRKRIEDGKAPNADNGVSLQPSVFELSGDSDEVFRYMERSVIRKNYTVGQRAALGVELHYREYKAKHGGKLPTLQKEIEDPDFISAEELAKRFNTNHYYIRIVRRLYRESPELFKTVAAGITPPPKAEAALKASIAGKTSPDGEGEAPPKPAKEPAKPRDADGEEVPERVADAFMARGAFLIAINHIEDAIRRAEQIAQAGAGAEHFNLETFAKAAKIAQRELKNSRPHSVCPDCNGFGYKAGHKDRKCARCAESGFLTRYLIQAEKKAAGGSGEEDE